MGGYLKQTGKRRDAAAGKMVYTLSIPNLEVRTTYTRIIRRYFSNKIENEKLEIMLKALIEGDIKLFEKMLRKVVQAVFSYHDFSGEPEKVYHALVAGLLIWISNTHEVKSNRESGYGRYDIMIIPRDPLAGGTDKGQIGYVMEFKAVDPEDDETAAPNIGLPLRSTLLGQLKQAWSGIQGAHAIQDKDITLHYLNGQIQVELVLDLDLLAKDPLVSKQQIAAQFESAARAVKSIKRIQVYFA